MPGPLWAQAEQAERAGDLGQAQALFQQLADQAKETDYDLWVRCLNRLEAIRERRFQKDTPILQQPARTAPLNGSNAGTSTGRFIPVPAQRPAGSSEYCYVTDSTHTTRLTSPVLMPASSPPPGPAGQWYEPGELHPTAIMVDGKPAYRLEPLNRDASWWIYVTADGAVNLAPYVRKTVQLYGPLVYRGDLRRNWMNVLQINVIR